MTLVLARLRPLFLLAFALLGLLGFLVVGPSPWLVTADADEVAYPIGELLRALTLPASPVLLLGLFATLASCDPRDVGAALRALFGRGDEAEAPAARRALAVGARSTVGAGLTLAFLAACAVFLLVGVAPDDAPSPMRVASLFHATIFAPLAALVVGRVILAGAADELAARHDLGRRTFEGSEDLALLLLALPTLLATLAISWPASPMR